MRKPVVAVVHADAETRDSLAAAIDEAFGDVVAVQTFLDANAVSEARAGWVTEARVHVLTVTDPRDTGELATLVALTLQRADLAAYFVFRELTSAADVEAHLRLRHAVYSASPDFAFLAARGDGEREVDEYDARSHLYGLFLVRGERETLVGTERITRLPDETVAHALDRVLAEHPALAQRAQTPARELPMIKDSPDAETIDALVSTCRAAGRSILEASRFAVSPEARGVGLPLSAATSHIIESTFAIALVQMRTDLALTGVRAAHAPLFKRLGMREIDGVRPGTNASFEVPVTALQVTLADVPAPLRQRLDSLAARLATRGEVCRCASFTSCIAGPYASGDLRGGDVLCPARVRELARQ